MEITRYSVNLEKSFHSTSLFLLEISNNPLKFLIVTHTPFIVKRILRKSVFFKVIHNIDKMHLQNIFNVEWKKRAGISREFYIDIDSKFLSEMFLIDDKITV